MRLDDPARLRAVAATGLVGRDASTRLGPVVRRAAAAADAPMALVSLVGEASQWHPAVVGAVPRELDVARSLCAVAIEREELLVVDDLDADARWSAMAGGGLRAYAGRPLSAPGGELLGTLCVLDVAPHVFGRSTSAALDDLAAWAEAELATAAGGDAGRARADELADLQARLLEATAHELRTPLTAIRAHAELLLDDPDGMSSGARASVEAILANAIGLQRSGDALLDALRRDAAGAEAAIRRRLGLTDR
ncbi:histidine kinase dimerization/phospho-acceptor domain-containing protein [Conexibacter sp. SYSU D00693]|uniref:histidine kinase dimerization/phospho-acceptor domain-containing protein n=1 Tax=Conexibacter sp. SYSU D00693 TaxID=2812560 RepID=UPI00196B6533|nr:histidine kinase dimerization/phospho-acceptor domain-containing protein [Conexibacter sp. SYSU D00693]